MVNQQFRKDYWVRGGRKMSTLEQSENIRAQKVILASPSSDILLKATGALGEASLSDAVYTPILEALSDHKAKSIGQLEQLLKGRSITFAQITQAILILVGVGHLYAVQDDGIISKTKKRTDKLNAHLIQKARGSSEITYLASPVTGGGIAVGRFQQLFLLAFNLGKKQPAEWAQVAWQMLQAQGQKILKDGKALETPEENVAELTTQAEAFAAKQFPILKALQIA
jgi:hypothetical protein